ncbi:thiamine pyrophosphate-dependent enzyme [Nonomuraea sp. SBT364]|uniref:thiamine pyrophosphate-dependent enzyme n=1 Tax=Nonomuraea sp. SBT364 TaxID=1580530 RepID=UPI00066D9063|nr:thiamine pyrophosphate-dependent enzyme [Nonomuraea sp. SBT364]
MNTEELVASVLRDAPQQSVIVCAPGRTSEVVYRARPECTLFIDSMGDVIPLALGIALAAPAVRVHGFETDGGLLMNLSVLPVLAAQLPENLSVVIVDNGIYESSGGLPSRTSPIDWDRLLGAFGIPPAALRVAGVTNDDPLPAATKPLDGAHSSYLVEALLSAYQGREPRLPARKV